MNRLIVLFSILSVMSCSKKDKDRPDCEKFNYGNVQLNFNTFQTQHSIEVIGISSPFTRNKSFDQGTKADTIRLPPGTYRLHSFSASPGNDPTLIQVDTISLTLCKDRLQLTIVY